MIKYFPKPKYLGGKVKVQLDLSIYTSKYDLTNDLASIKSDVGKFEKIPTNLRSLKSKVHKLGIGKLENTQVHLTKPSDEAKNNAIKKTQ